MCGFADIICFDLRRNARWMALSALGIFLLVPVLTYAFGANARAASRAMETASAFAGIAALCPVFVPERARGVRESVAAHGLPVAMVWGVRAAWLLIAVWMFSYGSALVLNALGCDTGYRTAMAGFSNAAFTGGIAALCAAASGSAALGAGVSLLLLALNACGVAPSLLTLFCNWKGLPDNKLPLCLIGIALTAAAVCVRTARERRGGLFFARREQI